MDSNWKLSSKHLIHALYNEIDKVYHRLKTQLLVKGSSKGKTASDCFVIAQQRELLQTKIDHFQSQALLFMKGTPSSMSAKETDTT